MKSFIFITINNIISYLKPSACVYIECSYSMKDMWYLKNVYICTVQNSPAVFSKNTVIDLLYGEHAYGKTNNEVIGVEMNGKIIPYFPQGLDNIFKNLLLVWLADSRLSEIHQHDLKPFENLQELHLHRNQLEVLEEGLFKYNTNLRYISFHRNRIMKIYYNIFDHLSRLESLHLDGNRCTNVRAEYSRQKTLEYIQIMKSQCPNPEKNTCLMAGLQDGENNTGFFSDENLKKPDDLKNDEI